MTTIANGSVPIATPEEVPVKAEQLESSVKLGTFAQIVVAGIAVIGLVYLLKLVLITTLVAILVAYVLEPLVSGLKKIGVPRSAAALMAVLMLLGLCGGAVYFSYNRAVDFVSQVPAYSGKIRHILGDIPAKAQQIEAQSRAAIEGQNNTGRRPPVTVRVEEPSRIGTLISENGGTILDVVLAVGFIPFLVYFMLAWKEHFQRATVQLFPREHRLQAHATVGVISAMIRSYIAGNAVIGIVSAAIFALTFGLLKLEYFYFLGALSGFFSLIPYVGLFLALLPPLAAGIGVLDRTGLIVIILTVTAVHVLAVNVLYPIFVGKRLQLNPVVVSLSLLFWSWIWGTLGLVLAIPLLGAAKIICDHVQSLHGLGTWLGESESVKST